MHYSMTPLIRKAKRLQYRLGDPSDVRAAVAVAAAIIATEVVLCLLIIWRVSYTEIDWEAYMEQTRMVSEGERDYTLIRGGTGPLVYPAGFVWLFDALRRVTHDGDIATAQLWFAATYIVSQAVVFSLYIWSQVTPPWVLVLLSASKRIHSIWLLRLFNDGPATAVALCGAVALLFRRPRLAVVVLSAAVSIKMHVLLLAPPVLVVLFEEERLTTIVQAAAGGFLLQLAVALPFLAEAPKQYLSRAFELSRVFLPEWSVNLKFLPTDVFLSPMLAAALLCTHVGLLLAFASRRWTCQQGGLSAVIKGCFSGVSVLSPANQDANRDTNCYAMKHRIPGSLSDTEADAKTAAVPGSTSAPAPAYAAGGTSGPRYGTVQLPRRSMRARAPVPADIHLPAVDSLAHDTTEVSHPVSSTLLSSKPSVGQKHCEADLVGSRPVPAATGRGSISSVSGTIGDERHAIGTCPEAIRAGHILATLFTGNLIGILCARTLHYQFYSWYYCTLPLLLWWSPLSNAVRIALWVTIEVLWNIFPSTPVSSLALMTCHVVLLAALWASPRWLHSQGGARETMAKQP